MAFFLLLYVLVLFIWLFWAGMLTYLLIKFRYPDKIAFPHLIIFWTLNVIILIVSFVFITRADWTTVPAFLGGV